MNKMKVDDFVSKLESIAKQKTDYRLGKFLNTKNKGVLLSDCSGLIKGILWGYPEKGRYKNNGIPDVNANTIISKYCTNVTSDMSKLKKGYVVWLTGHVGVYVGNGYVIECTPAWNGGVQKVKRSKRNWIKGGALNWIDYSSIKTTSIDYNKIAKEVIRGDFGNGHTNRENKIKEKYGKDVDYNKVKQLVNEIMKK